LRIVINSLGHEMKKLLLIVCIPLILLLILNLQHKNKTNSVKSDSSFAKSFNQVQNPDYIKKNINDIDALIEIPNKDKAIVVQIKNLKAMQDKNAIFKRAYKDDLVIFLPDKTIIYDPLTKTIRDISKNTFYNEVTK